MFKAILLAVASAVTFDPCASEPLLWDASGMYLLPQKTPEYFHVEMPDTKLHLMENWQPLEPEGYLLDDNSGVVTL